MSISTKKKKNYYHKIYKLYKTTTQPLISPNHSISRWLFPAFYDPIKAPRRRKTTESILAFNKIKHEQNNI
jgi:hypothetical protein